MATQLTKLVGALRTAEFIDYVSAFAAGVFDGVLVDKMPIAYLIKNIAVPIMDVVGLPIPKGITYESVGQLGFIMYLLLKR